MLVRARTSVTDFNFHLVFVTKYRKAIFNTPDKQNALKQILIEIAKHNDVQIQNMEVMPDHVHLLISFMPKYAASNIVKSFKGTSARMWFKQYPETKQMLWNGHLWSPSFFMSTIGNVSKSIVDEYINDQMKKSLN